MVFLFAMTDHVWLAVGLSFGQGVSNMIFVIPSQTLFQQRTPAALMGRVVGFRFSLVFGSMAIAMAVGRPPDAGPAGADHHRHVRSADDVRGAGRPARPGRPRRMTGALGYTVARVPVHLMADTARQE